MNYQQQQLFNLSYYDKKRNRYIVETTNKNIVIYCNEDGTVKRIKGHWRHTFAYGKDCAKMVARSIADEVQRSYVRRDNLLPVLYKNRDIPISFNYFIEKKSIGLIENWKRNILKQGFKYKEVDGGFYVYYSNI